MLHGETEKLGACGMGFDVVEGGEARDQVVEIDSVVILHTEVVDYQDKQDGARDMAEQARGGGFVKPERRQQSNNSHVAQLTGLFEPVHCLVYSEQNIFFALTIYFDKGKKRETRQDVV